MRQAILAVMLAAASIAAQPVEKDQGAPGPTGDASPDNAPETQLDFSEINHLIQEGWSPPKTPWQEFVSRDPVFVVHLWNGTRGDRDRHDNDDPIGFSEPWEDDEANPVESLVERVREAYDEGFRRFFLNRPHGTTGASHVGGGAWLSMSEKKRMGLQKRLVDAILDQMPDAEIIPFIGSNLDDPRERHGSGELGPKSHMLGQTDTSHRRTASRVTIGGWASAGASALAIDHASPPDERGHFARLHESLIRSPLRMSVWGEAFPRNPDGSLDQESITAMPWLALDRYIERRWDRLTVDPETTRMFVWFQFSEDDAEKVKDYMERGFIPMLSDPDLLPEGAL